VAMRMVPNVFSAFASALSNAFLIVLTVIFILLESAGFPAKLRAMSTDPDSSVEQFDTISENMKRYVAIKTTTSLATGVVVAIWLEIIGVDYPLLWGLLAFLLNFVPSIGSIIAAIPPVLLALVMAGPGTAGLVALGFGVVNVVIGSVIEPKYMGEGLGLSTLVVFLSLLFWGWVLGPVGMLLAVPLTMAVKIVLEGNEGTHAAAVLLGPSIKMVEPVPVPVAAVEDEEV
jgi:AI-2 transport protein TqsA